MTRDTFVFVTDLPLNERVFNSRRSNICASTLADAPCNLFDMLNAAMINQLLQPDLGLYLFNYWVKHPDFFLFLIR